SAPILAIGGVIMAVREDATLSWLLVVVVPLMALVIGSLLARAVPLFRAVQAKIDTITRVMREQITGVRVVRAFIRVGSERRRFEVANADLTDTSLRVNRIFVLAFPSLLGIMNLSTVAILWFGAQLIDSGDMPIGNLAAFMQYIFQILFAVMAAVFMVILIPRAEASSQRIIEVLDTLPSIAEPEHPVTPDRPSGEVAFRDVTFAYPHSERPVLHDISFVARPGATTAIIGGTGSGKTTVVNLVTRAFDATGGSVAVDGVDVREQALERLWGQMALVPQTAYLFKGTVAENLRFGGPEATDEDLWRALEIAQARDFVAAMKGQLEASIDQGGTNVSGGQRQRLAIARAIVKRPAIYLFDDCFSALDAATDARLRAALRRQTADAAVIIVAQRVSTILHADHIVVLDEGRVVGSGTHADLMRSSAQYREIVESQLGASAA
ncbi:MAG TPA: ABC transporter ATP-binding protein, partial [Candidatus Limnocylindria bacterium]|nr:ABC transporter ATP-binding protein [Candidatus Limnocylindria bacterium]